MQNNLQQIYNIYNQLYAYERQFNANIDERREAVLFAKALYYHQNGSNIITFCNDNEFFVNLTPTGYSVAGYYQYQNGHRSAFNVTLKKTNGFWAPAANYVAPDTKTGSSFIWLWILLMVGCSLFGIIMYYVMSAAIGF